MSTDNHRCLFLSFSGAVRGLKEGKLESSDFHNALYWLGCTSHLITLPFEEALVAMVPWSQARVGGKLPAAARARVPYFRFVRKQVRQAHAEGRVVWRAKDSHDRRLEPLDDFLGRFGYQPTLPVFEECQLISRAQGYAYGSSELDRAYVVFEYARGRYKNLRIFNQDAWQLNGD